MSTNLAEKRPSIGWIGRTAPRPEVEERPSHLEVVTTRSQRRARPRTVYAIIAVGVLFGVVVAQLLMSIAVSQGAYQLNSLQDKQTELQRSYQAASEDLNRLSSPQNLAANANALGMVTNSNPVYLRLSDGAVLGAPLPANGAAGTVTGGQGNLVPNSLLAGVPLAAAKTPAANATATPLTGAPAGSTAGSKAGATTGAAAGSTATGAQAENSGSTSAPDTQATPPTVPLDGALPTPVTH
ncbi:hypothetical protein ASE16_14140 [Leifsonia sp. Root227]|uniref:hypothetical protein n=1 Tax=Leifsonia sp. Root227 TaxID=1736496 RepID=UPI0006FF9633|nr:hypothetical protein [Leifsonia sp. Root227]KRC49816.1 hypothetical protein ASE16_14140 [Leifsonia sp. Root227]